MGQAQSTGNPTIRERHGVEDMPRNQHVFGILSSDKTVELGQPHLWRAAKVLESALSAYKRAEVLDWTAVRAKNKFKPGGKLASDAQDFVRSFTNPRYLSASQGQGLLNIAENAVKRLGRGVFCTTNGRFGGYRSGLASALMSGRDGRDVVEGIRDFLEAPLPDSPQLAVATIAVQQATRRYIQFLASYARCPEELRDILSCTDDQLYLESTHAYGNIGYIIPAGYEQFEEDSEAWRASINKPDLVSIFSNTAPGKLYLVQPYNILISGFDVGDGSPCVADTAESLEYALENLRDMLVLHEASKSTEGWLEAGVDEGVPANLRNPVNLDQWETQAHEVVFELAGGVFINMGAVTKEGKNTHFMPAQIRENIRAFLQTDHTTMHENPQVAEAFKGVQVATYYHFLMLAVHAKTPSQVQSFLACVDEEAYARDCDENARPEGTKEYQADPDAWLAHHRANSWYDVYCNRIGPVPKVVTAGGVSLDLKGGP